MARVGIQDPSGAFVTAGSGATTRLLEPTRDGKPSSKKIAELWDERPFVGEVSEWDKRKGCSERKDKVQPVNWPPTPFASSLIGKRPLSLSDDEEETYRKKQGFHTDEMEEAIRCGPRGGGANRR